MIKDRKRHGIVALCLALLIMALGVMTAAAAPTCTTTCYVDAVNGDDTNDGTTTGTALKTIQAAIDQVNAGGQVRVLPGSYDETATNRDVLGAGNYQFGLFFEETAKDGVTLMGVTAADVEITDPSMTLADITTNATNNFGTSGIFVEADDVTISGLEIGPNTPGEDKTIEIIGDNFTLKNSLMTGDGIDGSFPYVNDWRYDDVNDVSYVESYTFDNNIFFSGSQIAISSGAGVTGPVSGRQITNNDFTMGTGQNWPSISFNGAGGVAWFTYPVGGAVITGNTFNNDSYGAEQWIRARGDYVEAQFDWASYWNDNTYDNATVAYQTSLADPRPYDYSTFTNVRRIGAKIQMEIDTVAQAGDTVQVHSGVYPENVTLSKSLTLTGAGQGTNAAVDTILEGTGLNGSGIYINNNVIDVTIEDLRVQNYNTATPAAGVYANLSNHGLTVQNITTTNNGVAANNGGGIYMNGPVDDVLIDHVTASNNKTRGIVIWNGFKTHITLTNNTVTGNNCCGIELQDGTASGVTATDNTVTGNLDSGMAFTGLMAGAGPNLIADNTVTDNGRFGIEIKLPNGTGATSGDGSIVIEDNNVSLTATPTDLRDYAGIAAFRRGWVSGNNNVDIPTGVVIRNNTVSGYVQSNGASSSEGFGIVVEGTNMTVTGNTLTNNDVGAQAQGGHLPYTANTAVDGDQSNVADQFFGRGNSPVACALITGNTFSGNTADAREVGTGNMAVAQNTDTGEFFCTIQAAIDDADTLAGHTIEVFAGTHTENVIVNKSLTINGANAGVNPNDSVNPLTPNGARGPESEMAVTGGGSAFKVQAADVTIDGFKFTDSAVAQADVQSPIIGAGVNFGGDAPGVTIVNNLFFETNRTLVYFNGPTLMQGGTVDDNRVQNPDRPDTGCTGATAPSNCGHQLFNLWKTDDLSFQGNVTVASPASGDRIRTLNISDSTDVTIAGNTVRYTCTYTCFTIAANASGDVTVTGNDLVTDVGNVIQIHSLWTTMGATINVNHNMLTTGNDFPIVVDDLDADLDNVHINRNSISGTYHARNGNDSFVAGTETLDVECNWWGDSAGPNPANFFGPNDFTPWLYTSDLDGPCYVGGTIEVVKQAGDVGDHFEFDPSWSDDNFFLGSGDSQTSDPLPAGTYSVEEVNLPSGWSLDSANCVNEGGPLTPVDPVDPSSIMVEDYDAWVCTFTNVYTPPPANICPVEDADNLYTDILGIGMGNPKKHKTQAKLNVPNWMNVETLYGQLVAKDNGNANYVRFILPGKNNYVQVNGVTSAIDHMGGNFWYGDYIDPAKYVKGRWFLQKTGTKGHIPRAFILYPTYEDAAHTYVNVWDTYDASEGEVYWDTANGWTPYREIVVSIAPNNGPTTFHVEVAVVDNDKDNRKVWVTVTAGGVTQTVSPNNPDHGDQLNLLTFNLPNVPAGTDEITIQIASYEGDGVHGDSATLVGMAANYMCAPLNN